MTWSIIARDPASDRIGIAVATCNFAVGVRVPHIKTGIGAICTQAMTNPFFGPRGLALLTAGASAEDTVRMLMLSDEGRDHRQVHVMDREGRFAAATGISCVDWCGHISRSTISIAGNMLAGPTVLDATADAFDAAAGEALGRRLVIALKAGEAAGGDKRGRQSAALLVHDQEDDPMLDLRVDDHTDPLAELERLEAKSRERAIHARRFGPRRADPAGLIDRNELDVAIRRSIDEGYC